MTSKTNKQIIEEVIAGENEEKTSLDLFNKDLFIFVEKALQLKELEVLKIIDNCSCLWLEQKEELKSKIKELKK